MLLGEVRSNGEARIFLGGDPANNQLNQSVMLSPTGVVNVSVYLLVSLNTTVTLTVTLTE